VKVRWCLRASAPTTRLCGVDDLGVGMGRPVHLHRGMSSARAASRCHSSNGSDLWGGGTATAMGCQVWRLSADACQGGARKVYITINGDDSATWIAIWSTPILTVCSNINSSPNYGLMQPPTERYCC